MASFALFDYFYFLFFFKSKTAAKLAEGLKHQGTVSSLEARMQIIEDILQSSDEVLRGVSGRQGKAPQWPLLTRCIRLGTLRGLGLSCAVTFKEIDSFKVRC